MATNLTDYDFQAIESHWQSFWEKNKTFQAKDCSKKPKYYMLDMFPYPSGSGLHAGHTENYTASDILDRYLRAKGFNVLHPMGWDAFGLPAEQYAINTGTHPAVTTEKNINFFREQIKQLGIAIDWDREVNTTDPKYYRWTQWIFLQLFKRGLAYVDERPVNWCQELGTVLANEEVIDGKSERGGFPVERRNLRQWVLRITAYADRLLEGLDTVDWPSSTKTQQINWIGKSEGADVFFDLAGNDGQLKVFTTRPDTLFGATYMVLAPEHPLVEKITSSKQKAEVDNYCQMAASKSDLDRTDLAKDKSGVFTGAYAINPVNQEQIPIWVADYVLMSYGTGAIMAVPGHDVRDYEFAVRYNLPIIRVIDKKDENGNDVPLPFVDVGTMINSGSYSGLRSDIGKKKITSDLESESRGKFAVNFRLRDWLFSRQRYWGEPFPIIWVDAEAYNKAAVSEGPIATFIPQEPVTYMEEDQTWYALPLPPAELPLKLPVTDNYKPSGDANSPLSNVSDWVNVWCNLETGQSVSVEKTDKPATGNWARGFRETNTMPQWAGSCWYYLRYSDPNNSSDLISAEKEAYWQVPDLYIGGAEHAVLHLLYARFWHMVLYDAGIVTTKEPFTKLFHQGIILGEIEFSLYTDKAGNPVSIDNIDIDNFEGSTRKLTEDDVEKQRRGNIDIFILKDDPTIRVEAKTYKMSKSRGNVVNPDHYIDKYGADSLRMYEMFMGPLEDMKPWSAHGIEGPHRFLRRVWRLMVNKEGKSGDTIIDQDEEKAETEIILHQTIKKVSEDIEKLAYNTAISQLMVLRNHLQGVDTFTRKTALAFVQLLAPFAPHMAEELWSRLGELPSVTFAPWPKFDLSKLVIDEVKIGILVNGKPRGETLVSKNAKQDEVLTLAQEQDRVRAHLNGKTIRKIIYVPGKIINIVAN